MEPEEKRAAGAAPMRLERIDGLLIAAIVIGFGYLYIAGIGSYALWDPWEPKYAVSMLEMEERGDYITPYLDGKIRWTKPVLYYWTMALPMAIGGNNEFTARLPSAVAAILGLVMVYFFLSRLRGRRTGALAACILGTIPQYFYLARQAMPDMLMTLCLAGAMGWLALARFGSGGKRLPMSLFFASLALAFLAKGPVTVCLAIGAIFLFAMIDFKPAWITSVRTMWSRVRSWWGEYHVTMGLIVFVAVAGPWYGTMLLKHGYAFIDHFIVSENLHRFESSVRGHHGVSTFYVDTLFHGMYPWGCLLLAGGLFSFSGWNRIDEEVRQKWYYLAWALSAFLIFTFAGTKLQHYLLPATPAIAILTALILERYLEEDAPGWVPLAFLLSVALLLLPIRDFLTEGNKYLFDNFTNKRTIEVPGIRTFLLSFLVAWGVIMIAGCFRRKSLIVVSLAVIAAYGNGLYFSHHVIPKHTVARSMQSYLEVIRDHFNPDSPLLFYAPKMRHSLYYYRDKSKSKFFKRRAEEELVKFAQENPDAIIIARTSYAFRLRLRLKRATGDSWSIIAQCHPRYVLMVGDSH